MKQNSLRVMFLLVVVSALFVGSTAMAERNEGPGKPGKASYAECYDMKIIIDFYSRQYRRLSMECRSSGSWAICDAAASAYENWHKAWGDYWAGDCFGYPLVLDTTTTTAPPVLSNP